MNNLKIFNVDNEQQELYFLLELDGGSQVQFNDPPLILTSLIKTPTYTIFNTITFTIIFNILTIIIKTLIYITIIFIIFIFSIFVLSLLSLLLYLIQSSPISITSVAYKSLFAITIPLSVSFLNKTNLSTISLSLSSKVFINLASLIILISLLTSPLNI